jgi:hypothetical protein
MRLGPFTPSPFPRRPAGQVLNVRSMRSPPVWADLVGVPYERMDCYQLAREASARLGVELPAHPADLLAHPIGGEVPAGEACRAGDLLDIEERRGDGTTGTHIGVCINAFEFLHAVREGTSRIDRIAAWQRLGAVRRRVRPGGLP